MHSLWWTVAAVLGSMIAALVVVQIIHAASPATPLADLHQEIRAVWLLS